MCPHRFGAEGLLTGTAIGGGSQVDVTRLGIVPDHSGWLRWTR